MATAYPIFFPSNSSKYKSTAKLPAAVAIAPPNYPVCLADYIFPFISNLFTFSKSNYACLPLIEVWTSSTVKCDIFSC